MKLIDYLNDSDDSIKSLSSKVIDEKNITIKNSELIDAYLSHFDPNTQKFGNGIYSPKWISTFYTLRDLIQFNIDYKNLIFQKGIDTLIHHMWNKDHFIEDDICVVVHCPINCSKIE